MNESTRPVALVGGDLRRRYGAIVVHDLHLEVRVAGALLERDP